MLDIAKAKLKDLESIRGILSQWTEAEEVEKYVSRIAEEIEGEREFNARYWVGKLKGKIVGVVGISDPLPKVLGLAKGKNPGEIKILYIDGKERGKGVGRILVNLVERKALSEKYDELLVRSAERYKNTAYGFYEKMGYVKVGVVSGGSEDKKMQVVGKVLRPLGKE